MRTLRRILCICLAFAILVSLILPSSANDYSDVVECEYCNEPLMEWGLCPNCSGCSEEANPTCWAEHHCHECGCCLVSDDPASYCNECFLCCDCWDDDEHCDNCYKHSSDICTECGLCDECGWDVIDLCCFECGAHTCNNYCVNIDENMISHCADCCLLCNMCGECWHSRGGAELCEYCGCCPECTEDPMLHCPECGACYENADMCESGEAHCRNCCEDVGLVCENCGGIYCGNESEFCDDCGMCISCAIEEGLHCPECEEAHIECEDCGLCLDCAEAKEKHCPECGRCYEIYSLCADGGDHCSECCEENDWLCPQCEECTEGTGNEICQFCGLCSQCCLQNSEAAGYSDGTCIYDQNGIHAEELYICEQCGGSKYPTQMCEMCWLCKDCCLQNSRDAGCDCGMCVNDFGFNGHDCSKIIRFIDIYGVPVPAENGLKTTEGIGIYYEDDLFYTIESVKWLAKGSNDKTYSSQAGSSFKKGYAYAVRLVLRSGEGSVFSDNLMISLNGENAIEYTVALSKADNMATVTVFAGSIGADKQISEVRLYPDVTDPQAGQKINSFCDVQNQTGYKNLGQNAWMTCDRNNPDSESEMAAWSTGNFFGGKYWFLKVSLKPEDGYTFGFGTDIYVNDCLVPDNCYLISYNKSNNSYSLITFIKYISGDSDISSVNIKNTVADPEGRTVLSVTENIRTDDETKISVNRTDCIAYAPDGSSKYVYEDEKIVKGWGYKLRIILRAENGYLFDPDVAAYIDGKAAGKENTRVSGDRRYLYVDIDYGFFGETQIISRVDITNIPVKIWDSDPLPVLKPEIGQKHISILSAEWQHSENGSNWFSCGHFELCDPDMDYRVVLKIKADYGYEIKSQNSFYTDYEQQQIFGVKDGNTYLVMISVSNDARISCIDELCFTGVPEPEYGKPVITEGPVKKSGIKYTEKYLYNNPSSSTGTSFYWLYSADGNSWKDFTGEYFEAGYYYCIKFSGEINWTEYKWYNPDYSDDPYYSQAFVNGVRADKVETEEADNTYYIYVFKKYGKLEKDAEALNIVQLNMTAPSKDGEIGKSVPALSVKAAKVTSYAWTLAESGAPASGKFAAGKNYLLTVEIEPSAGFVFTPMTRVLINGKLMSITQSDGKITAVLSFNIEDSFASSEGLGNLISAKMLTPPTKVKYKKGEEIVLGGLRIQADYENGSKCYTDGEGVTASIKTASAEGKQTVSLSFESYIFKYEITVEKTATVITGIELTKLPAKTTYIVGERLRTAGMEVTVHTTNGDRIFKDGKNIITTPGIFSTEGEQAVTVHFSGKRCSFNVSVSEPAATEYKSISIERLPFRTKYTEGELPDLTGLIVKIITNKDPVILCDGKDITVTGIKPLTAGQNKIVLEYNGLTAEFEIEAVAGESDKSKHIHSKGELIAESPSTCTKTGMKAHYVCETCGRYLNTDETAVPIEELIFPLAPHTVSDVWSNNAEFHWKQCSVCNTVLTARYEHHFIKDSESCETCGYIKKGGTSENDNNNDNNNNNENSNGTKSESCSRIWLIILIAVVAVALTVTIICMVRKKKSKENQQ